MNASRPASAGHLCTHHPDWTIGLRAGDSDRNDELQTDCPACRRSDARAAAISAWEDQPLDPRDDLALIAGYPGERARLREIQRAIAANPYYQVVDRIGGRLRAAWLAECTDANGVDDTAAEDFHTARLCRCTLAGLRELGDGTPIYQRHRDADQCGPCWVLDALLESAHAALLASAGVALEVAS